MQQPLRVTRIISGGQTGADHGGLLAARDLGIATGGTAPRGWKTETGPEETLLQSFGLIECAKAGYRARTHKNVVDAEGTLIVGYITGGSALTAKFARELNKPFFTVAFTAGVVPNDESIEEFRSWLQRYDIEVLNVAGNRESKNPGIQAFTHAFLLAVLG